MANGTLQNIFGKIVDLLDQSQKHLDKEVDKALTVIKRSANDVEKNLEYYREKAKTQTQKLEKLLKAQAAARSTKAAPAKNSSSTGKGAKKTSRKKATKKR